MHYNSRQVVSTQEGVHPQLVSLLEKNRVSTYQKPIAEHNLRAFDELQIKLREDKNTSLILDTGCGTGDSSLQLSKLHPGKIIVGVDRSLARLSKEKGEIPPHIYFTRADLEDFLRLLFQHQFYFSKIYFLYPNPYPKSTHLNQRWHGHALFPTILSLTGEIELRTNWEIYAQEFSFALSRMGWKSSIFSNIKCEGNWISPFERKYDLSGHPLFQVQATSKPL